MDPQDPYVLMRRVMLMVLMVLMVMFPFGCTSVNIRKCTPGFSLEKKDNCTFDSKSPAACVGEVWVRVDCPME